MVVCKKKKKKYTCTNIFLREADGFKLVLSTNIYIYIEREPVVYYAEFKTYYNMV